MPEPDDNPAQGKKDETKTVPYNGIEFIPYDNDRPIEFLDSIGIDYGEAELEDIGLLDVDIEKEGKEHMCGLNYIDYRLDTGNLFSLPPPFYAALGTPRKIRVRTIVEVLER